MFLHKKCFWTIIPLHLVVLWGNSKGNSRCILPCHPASGTQQMHAVVPVVTPLPFTAYLSSACLSSCTPCRASPRYIGRESSDTDTDTDRHVVPKGSINEKIFLFSHISDTLSLVSSFSIHTFFTSILEFPLRPSTFFGFQSLIISLTDTCLSSFFCQSSRLLKKERGLKPWILDGDCLGFLRASF
ncbi:hypothetical protein VTN77DRAFT_6577 [Rasamsonia byssochlamydoides]|uniref:uncharacterized protein n=1 Tax=Rasamsonia byssochlamydoides TaxID=89139 RepID=UPI003743D4FB